MKKPILLIIYCLLFTVCSSYAQVPADSLPGTYAGQYWYANPYTNPWVITPDTLYVSSVDSVNCRIDAHCNQFVVGYSSASGGYFTNYYTCNDSTSITGFIKFYNSDSIRMIYDDLPQPPPNQPISQRFYGKRIRKIVTGLNELAKNKQVCIYPNPCNDILNIECKILDEKVQLIIIDILGREIRNENILLNEKAQINVSDLKRGIYLLQIRDEKETLIKKFIIN